jgi:misacylated tRNA(Ala) deacylase
MQDDRLYLIDAYIREFDATVVDSDHGWCVLSQTAFYPGGGGQPPDGGWLIWNDRTLAVRGVREDAAGRLWHDIGRDLSPAAHVRGTIDWPNRYACMRSHCLLHLVNAVARRRFGGLVTGAQIGPGRSRVDLSVTGFTRDDVPAFEAEVNAVAREGCRVTAVVERADALDARPELVRTLTVRPPVVAGTVRVVEIEGFDAQACGGTHASNTSEVGTFSIFRTENKGKINKRLYVRLERPGSPAARSG